MKKNVLFTTTVFSIDEKDGLSRPRFERSFIAALEKMVRFGGMYVWPDRKFEYLSTRRVLTADETAPKIVFGVPYSYPQAIATFNKTYLDFIDKGEEENEAAKCVYNARVGRIIPVSENDIVLPESVLEGFLGKRTPIFGQGKQSVVFSDCSFELGIGSQLKSVPLRENFQTQLREFLINGEIDYIKINKINFFSDGTSIVEMKKARYLFKRNAWVSFDWAQLHFSSDRMMRMFLKQYPEDGYLYDVTSDKLQRVPEISFFVSDTLLKKWTAD